MTSTTIAGESDMVYFLAPSSIDITFSCFFFYWNTFKHGLLTSNTY